MFCFNISVSFSMYTYVIIVNFRSLGDLLTLRRTQIWIESFSWLCDVRSCEIMRKELSSRGVLVQHIQNENDYCLSAQDFLSPVYSIT